jgi:putative transposase
VHLKVANRRADFLHQLTTRLARTKRAIAVESLNVAGMVRNRRLARAVSDAGFGEFVRDHNAARNLLAAMHAAA